MPLAQDYIERPVAFDCCGDELLGVLSLPPVDRPGPETAVLIVVGGPQYRAGSHRHFVETARRLAAEGHACLRFDVRGMGDSTGAPRDFRALSDDIAAAIDQLQRGAPTIRRVVLWGLCDGASAALLYLHQRRDRRVTGLCLLNPWVRSEETLAAVHLKHYYARRLLSPEAWRKLLTGAMGLKALRDFARSVGTAAGTRLRRRGAEAPAAAGAEADYVAAMTEVWLRFDGAILLVLSGDDFTAREFLERAQTDAKLGRALMQSKVARLDLPEADHTLSDRASRAALDRRLLAWLAQLAPAGLAPALQAEAA